MRVLVLLLFSIPVFAAPVELTCTNPTQNEDGSPLTDLAGIRFYESQVSGGPYVEIADKSVCSLTIERDAGTYYYVATAYNDAGTESQYSNEAVKTIEASPPAPPSNLTAHVDTIAYAIQQFTDGITFYPVAVVTDTTACDPYVKITTANHPKGKSLIPVSAVDFVGGASARTVYAECSAGS